MLRHCDTPLLRRYDYAHAFTPLRLLRLRMTLMPHYTHIAIRHTLQRYYVIEARRIDTPLAMPLRYEAPLLRLMIAAAIRFMAYMLHY